MNAMTSGERRAVVTLASIFALRMIGLFMIMPVFAIYGRELDSATPLLIGLAIGVYGLAQAFLQIPIGLLADRFDRKWLVIIGLGMFVLGGVIAASSTSIWGVIIGRTIQGAGAISGVVMALLADLTREEQRTKAMAAVGMTIGLSFAAAFVIGPWLTGIFGLAGLFWSTAALGAVGMAVCMWAVPRPIALVRHTPVSYRQQLSESLKHGELLRLNFGIFILHMVMTACFVALPLLLYRNGGLDVAQHGWVYLPVLFGSFVLIVPAIIMAEKKRQMKEVFVMAIAILSLGLACLGAFHQNLWALVLGMMIFFIGFNLLEALLPSLVSKISPAGGKATAMGIYSSSQFFGAFCGGILGGWLWGRGNEVVLFGVLTVAVIIWLIAAIKMAKPRHLNSILMRFDAMNPADVPALMAKLNRVAGVEDVVLVVEDRVAYLKVDREVFDDDALAEFPASSVAT